MRDKRLGTPTLTADEVLGPAPVFRFNNPKVDEPLARTWWDDARDAIRGGKKLAEDAPSTPPPDDATKFCSLCNVEKPLATGYHRRSRTTRFDSPGAYYAQCKECRNGSQRRARARVARNRKAREVAGSGGTEG